jgi:tripartite-type tricarboxylate transporter receptor subunit TctC
MLEFWMAQSATARAIFTPPGVPVDRVTVLRRAFDQTVKDPAFLAEVSKLKTVIEPDTGEEVQNEVKRLLGTSPEVAAAIVKVLK